MPDFSEDTTTPTTNWNEATGDPTKLYGVGRYGVGKYGEGFPDGGARDFTEVS